MIEYGKVPNLGAVTHVTEDEICSKGDILGFKYEMDAPYEVAIYNKWIMDEQGWVSKVKSAVASKGHKLLYMYIDVNLIPSDPESGDMRPDYVYIKCEYIILALHSSFVAIVLAIAFLLIAPKIDTIVRMIMVSIYKVQGITPEELKGYEEGLPSGFMGDITTILLIVAAVIIASVIFKSRR